MNHLERIRCFNHHAKCRFMLSLLFEWICVFSFAMVGYSQEHAEHGSNAEDGRLSAEFDNAIAPLLQKLCVRCHNMDKRESGIRLDALDGSLAEATLSLWDGIRKQVESGAMPPEDEPAMNADERRALVEWIQRGLHVARSRDVAKNGAVRRLTVAQYRNTMRELLLIDENLTSILPPDSVSKDGFTNNVQTLMLSPSQIESFFEIAQRALDIAIVDETKPPTIEHFRMDLGRGINSQPCPDKLVLGANNLLLNNEDFVVSEPKLDKPFEFSPFQMQREFRFIEGYQGNDTVRGWRDFSSIYHAVFACMRGSEGYPKGKAYETVPGGLLLRPAIPSPEIFGESNTYGPHANFKISLRELPDHGRFRVTVRAAKYNDGLLLDPKTPDTNVQSDPSHVISGNLSQAKLIQVEKAGLYLVDVDLVDIPKEVLAATLDKPAPVTFVGANGQTVETARQVQLNIGDRSFGCSWTQSPFVVLRLPAGACSVSATSHSSIAIQQIELRRLEESHPLAQRFLDFEKRMPNVGVHVGLRRDCGSTMTAVGRPQRVASTEFQDYVFEDAIQNFPSPDVEKDNVNYLAGIREIGVRCEYTDGRDMPRLMIQSVDFEGPFYPSWPPPSHRRVFHESPNEQNESVYALEILTRFSTRAFRRPPTDVEIETLMDIWRARFRATSNFRQSIRETLTAILTSPQFLFLIEASEGPESEELTDWELASKLSYFLWNAPPDDRLFELAKSNILHASLDGEADRLMDDPRFGQFVTQFAAQWLSLDKFEVVETDAKRYPKLTRDVKTELLKEPAQFLQYLLRNNRPLRELIRSDYVLANEVVASYYGIAERTEHGFEFDPIPHDKPKLGGVLAQASVLAGLSDGRESNPVKRGAWFARRIIAVPPEEPPPNVPKLEDLTQLTLRQRLEKHRNIKGCIQCHMTIDPWGLPFEQFDAGGMAKSGAVDAQATLPTGKDVQDFERFRDYLQSDYLDQVAFGFSKHLSAYAIGRSLTYNETHRLREQVLACKDNEYKLRDLVHFVIQSDLFLKK